MRPLFIDDLLAWYQCSQRSLPWRLNPGRDLEEKLYRTWISEVMSQQSTLATVVPKYEKWMQEYPRFQDLQKATLFKLEKLWSGLGYYSRVRNIFKIAKEVNRLSDLKESADWLKLKGIGPYTSNALGAICYDEARIPLDGNVIRVASRLWSIPDPLNNSKDRVEIESQLEKVAQKIPPGKRGDAAQAFIELGATVCRPFGRAECSRCPLAQDCLAFSKNKVAVYPEIKVRPQTISKDVFFLLYRKKNDSNKILLRQIPKGFPLQGQWEIPWLGEGGWLGLRGTRNSKNLSDFKHLNLNTIAGMGFPLGRRVKHQIMQYSMSGITLEVGVWEGELPGGHVFYNPNSKTLSLTTHSRKILQSFF